ncbi:hypothetical protein [Streptomyces sp. NPDC006134]|uniref:hypothetical protein n=1 Tax=Streptomyces sp. NPDC006134 TaxID=3154467 RepID=UPI0033FCCA42
MSRLLRVFGVGVLVVSAAGYAATEYITSTLPTPAPPSPYGSEPPPPDCTEPEERPADCPLPGAGCPPRATPQASPAGTSGPEFKAEPSPHPTLTAYAFTESVRPPGSVYQYACDTVTLVATRK